jgi:hypothetical protein
LDDLPDCAIICDLKRRSRAVKSGREAQPNDWASQGDEREAAFRLSY